MRSSRLTTPPFSPEQISTAASSCSIPYRWNSLELYEEGKTSLLRYTNMRHQPWLSWRNPLARIWCASLLQAVSSGEVSRHLVKEHISRGWLRPSTAMQIDQDADDPLLLELGLLKREESTFLPPHMQPRNTALRAAAGYGELDSSLMNLQIRRVLALLRHQLWRSGLIGGWRQVRRIRDKIARAVVAGRARNSAGTPDDLVG
ncbi:MAG: hypothetical protein IPM40_00220 [Gammaproteobacteria bacterium]|nr:hypothetical protein [Gammaproteobacteria bacterium]